MQTTATFDAIHSLVKRRNSALDTRDEIRAELRGPLTVNRRKELEIQFWSTVGEITGIQVALEALREAGEHVGSAEYLAIEERRRAVTA